MSSDSTDFFFSLPLYKLGASNFRIPRPPPPLFFSTSYRLISFIGS